MKCRHGHRWLGDRCVMGWCKQEVEEKAGGRGVDWSWELGPVESRVRLIGTDVHSLTELENVLQENLSSMASSVRVPVAGVYRCSDVECRLCNSGVWDE